MTHYEAATLAKKLMIEHGLTSWVFKWDYAKRRAGLCNYRRKTIQLSHYYVSLNEDKPDDIKDTILHEIAHALAGPRAGHGPDWRYYCRKIGANPVRCYDSNKIEMPKGRYRAECPSCNKSFHTHRRPKNGAWRYCLACGPERGRLSYYDSVALAATAPTGKWLFEKE